MKLRILIVCMAITVCSSLYALTPGECLEAIEANKECVQLLVVTLSTNEWMYLFLGQPNCYGVFGAQYHGIQLRKKSQAQLSASYEFVPQSVSFPIVFGRDIGGCAFIPMWLGFPESKLCCRDFAYDGFPPLDICCLCDEEDSRKRPRQEESDDPFPKRPRSDLNFSPFTEPSPSSAEGSGCTDSSAEDMQTE